MACNLSIGLNNKQRGVCACLECRADPGLAALVFGSLQNVVLSFATPVELWR